MKKQTKTKDVSVSCYHEERDMELIVHAKMAFEFFEISKIEKETFGGAYDITEDFSEAEIEELSDKCFDLAQEQEYEKHVMTKELAKELAGDRLFHILKDEGYCARIVPAISADPYPHFQHKNAIILISCSSVIFFTSLLFNW